MELNKVILIGNLTRDPESRTVSTGSSVCSFRLATSRRRAQKEEVLYIDVEAWNRTAELCSQFLQKGSQILVEGRLKMDTYKTQSGEERTKFVIVAEAVQFGARAGGGEGGPGGGGGYQPRSGGGGNPGQSGGGYRGGGAPSSYDSGPESRSQYSHPSSSGPGDSYDGDGGTEDDLPF